MKKVRGAVIAAAVAASVMVVPGMPVALAAENGSLLWGIRASFNNYVGGPVLVGDGATEDKSTGAQRFSFPLENANYDRDEVRLERVSDCLCAGAWFTSSPRIGLGMPQLVG